MLEMRDYRLSVFTNTVVKLYEPISPLSIYSTVYVQAYKPVMEYRISNRSFRG
jgi:hypothetical protein